jgi:hypothetical protein
MDKCDKIIETILGKDGNNHNEKNLEIFKNYLLTHLKLPVRVTGIEDFPWEEMYVFGFGSQKDYAKMKKDNPSYTDEFDLLDIKNSDRSNDLLGKIKRLSDRKIFDFELSWLKVVDEKSSAFYLMDAYAIWHTNY